MDNPPPLTLECLSEMDSKLEERTVTRTNQVLTDKEYHSSIQQQDPLLMPSPHSVQIEGEYHQAPEGSVRPAQTEVGLEAKQRTEDVTYQHSEGGPRASSGPPNSDTTGLRQSTRANKGTFTSTRYIDEVFFSHVSPLENLNNYSTALIYQAEIETDMDTHESNISDPRVYNAKFANRGIDPDILTIYQALSGL